MLPNFSVIVQVALVLVLVRQFQNEGTAFVRFAALVFVAFGLHAFRRLRMPLVFFRDPSAVSLGLALVAGGFAPRTPLCTGSPLRPTKSTTNLKEMQ